MLSICIYAYFLPYNENSQGNSGIFDFSEGWEYKDAKKLLSIDGSKYEDGEKDIVVCKQLPKSLPHDAVLYMRSNHNEVACFINGRELFCEGVCKDRTFGITYTGIWITIPLLQTDAGQPVELHIKKTDGNTGQLPQELILANRNTLTQELMAQTSVRIIIAFFTIAIGMFATAYVLKRGVYGQSNGRVLWLAVFILISGVWMLMDDNIAVLFAPYNDAFYFLSFYSFMLLPVPFSLFIGECIPKSQRAMRIFSIGFITSFSLSVISAVFFKKPLSFMLPMTHILILMGFTAILIYAFKDRNESGEIRLKELVWGLCLFTAAAAAALAAFYSGNIRVYAILFKVAMLLFIAALSWGTLMRAIKEVERARGFEELTQTIPSGICRLNCRRSFAIAYGNDSYYKMFGYEPSEAKEMGFTQFDYILFEEDRERLRKELSLHIKKKEEYFEIVARAKHKSGSNMHILTTNNYLPEQEEIVSSLTDITIRVDMEDKLRVSEMEFRIATEQSEKYIIRYEVRTKRLYSQKRAVEQFGMEKICEDAVNRLIKYNFIAPSSIEKHKEFFDKIHKGQPSGSAVMEFYTRDIGMYRWYHVDFTTVFDNYNEADQAIISFYDITEQREKELAYELLRMETESMPKEQITTFECNITQDKIDKINGNLIKDMTDSLGFDERTRVYLSQTHNSDKVQLAHLMNRNYLMGSFANGAYSHKLEFRMKINDVYHWLLLSIQIVEYNDNNDIKAYVAIRDIDTKKTSEIELIKRSKTDGLTGIMNRAAFVGAVDELIEKTEDTQHTLVMMDVDYFKDVNDTLGHDIGDKVLREVALDLQRELRDGDLLGRMGGDEFAFCLVGMYEKEAVNRLLERVRALLNHGIDGGLFQSVSMGAAIFGEDARNFTVPYKKADIALYKAKRDGRNRFAVYDNTME